MAHHGALVSHTAAAADVTRGLARAQGLNLYPVKGPAAFYNGTHNFPTFTLDAFFANETVGFMHLDLEGYEYQALTGARRVLERDQPLLTTESTVHYDANATRAQLSLLQAAGYDSYLIEEIAGMRADVRNLLHVPRSRKGSFVGSNALDLAVAVVPSILAAILSAPATTILAMGMSSSLRPTKKQTPTNEKQRFRFPVDRNGVSH